MWQDGIGVGAWLAGEATAEVDACHLVLVGEGRQERRQPREWLEVVDVRPDVRPDRGRRAAVRPERGR